MPVGAQGARSGEPGRAPSGPPPSGQGFPLWENSQPTASRRRRRDLPTVAALVLVFLILSVAVMCTGSIGSSTGEDRTPERTTTVRTTTPTSTDPTIPATTVGPACFPFQPGC